MVDINKKEYKPIIDAINNLTPWDREELIEYIILGELGDEFIKEYVKDYYGVTLEQFWHDYCNYIKCCLIIKNQLL